MAVDVQGETDMPTPVGEMGVPGVLGEAHSEPRREEEAEEDAEEEGDGPCILIFYRQ